MHKFEYRQPGEKAIGCEIKLDGQELICESFELIAKAGEVTKLKATILLSSVDVTVDTLAEYRELRDEIKKVKEASMILQQEINGD